MRFWTTVAAMAATLAAAALPAAAADDENGIWLADKIANARDGAVIDVPAGGYAMKDVKIERSLTLRGPANGEAVLYYPAKLAKGVLIPRPGASVRVENLTFKEATSWDKNGAGIRHEGRDLTVVNCKFIGNEDGILATGEPEGNIVIVGSEFIDNGFGDGYSHGIYVSKGASLKVDRSKFIGTRIGHHVKSHAKELVVTNSLLDDADGRASYAVEAARGGTFTVTGNRIVQSADADNSYIFSYDIYRGGLPDRILIEGNTIVNRYAGGKFIRNPTNSKPIIRNNRIVNEGRAPLQM